MADKVAGVKADVLDFDLPTRLIAQDPPEHRPDAKLLAYDRGQRKHTHRTIRDLPGLLRPGDLLVFNDTTVVPARFAVRKGTGGIVEGLRIREIEKDVWQVLLKQLGPIRPEVKMNVVGHPSATLRVTNKMKEGYRAEVEHPYATSDEVLTVAGRMPLPPYIRRLKARDPRDEHDRDRYQTVFNNGRPTSVAAPTAGLHFDADLLGALRERGC